MFLAMTDNTARCCIDLCDCSSTLHVHASSEALEEGQDINLGLSGHNVSRLRDFVTWINFQSVKVCPLSGT